MNNKSPWLEQLDSSRKITELNHDLESDLVIVGGGIAGITTAYFLLKNTSRKIVLIEAGRIAHGATGHNAGQVIVHIERDFSDLVKEYGQKKVVKAFDQLNAAWDFLDSIITDAEIKTPLFKKTGICGYANLHDMLEAMETALIKKENGMQHEVLYVSEKAPYLNDIPSKFKDLYTVVPHQTIYEKLDSVHSQYFAVGTNYLVGCINSALFVEELAGYLISRYSDRFTLYEQAPVKKITLEKKRGVLLVRDNVIISKKVILCTNGFENLHIINLAGHDTDAKFHDEIRGVVGYMAGYKENSNKEPGAFAYFEKNEKSNYETPYFYLTRRPYSTKAEPAHHYNLVCIGGPESSLPEGQSYSRENVYPDEAKKEIDHFVKTNLNHDLRQEIDYRFFWHGLMGYTRNGLRMVGYDPCNKVLLYNLGCNGVGILTSIFGAERISKILSGRRVAASIFDPFKMQC